LEKNGGFLLIDEQRRRRIDVQSGIKIIGTFGIGTFSDWLMNSFMETPPGFQDIPA
jgi:hypothetical protein